MADRIETSLARARGLGSAHEGSGHWLQERLTSVALLPLMLWLAWAVAHVSGWSYEEFRAWLAQPVNSILMLLSVVTAFYHAALGCQVITEDYVHHEGAKFATLLTLKLAFVALGTACVFAILKIAFTG